MTKTSPAKSRRLTLLDFHQYKHEKGPKIVMLTAYSAPMARLMDPHCDALLVGDSLGMVLYGMDNTLGVSLDMMIQHGKAVVSASQRACVIVDMPFMTFEKSKEQAYANAAKLLRLTGASAIKIEGGAYLAETIAFLSARGIPVVGHIGLLPQHLKRLGGFKVQGKNAHHAQQILSDAKQLADAGAQAIVIEAVPEFLGREITHALSIPTLGIGASPDCDGQVLVSDDIIGISGDFIPKFAKRYTDIRPTIEQAVATYAHEVRTGAFPTMAQCYTPDKE